MRSERELGGVRRRLKWRDQREENKTEVKKESGRGGRKGSRRGQLELGEGRGGKYSRGRRGEQTEMRRRCK